MPLVQNLKSDGLAVYLGLMDSTTQCRRDAHPRGPPPPTLLPVSSLFTPCTRMRPGGPSHQHGSEAVATRTQIHIAMGEGANKLLVRL